VAFYFREIIFLIEEIIQLSIVVDFSVISLQIIDTLNDQRVNMNLPFYVKTRFGFVFELSPYLANPIRPKLRST
jgi:hypothetical protein